MHMQMERLRMIQKQGYVTAVHSRTVDAGSRRGYINNTIRVGYYEHLTNALHCLLLSRQQVRGGNGSRIME